LYVNTQIIILFFDSLIAYPGTLVQILKFAMPNGAACLFHLKMHIIFKFAMPNGAV